MADDEPLRRELAAHERRLAVLREQAALKGYTTDPATTLEIADVEQAIAKLRSQLGETTVAAPAATSAGLPQPGGDVITATISGSRNVAVGKNISQQVGSDTARATDDLSTGLAALEQAVASAPDLTPANAALATFQLQLLGGELLKNPEDGAPSANVVIQVGEWLLANAPTVKPALVALLTSPPCQRVLTDAARSWVQRRV